MTDFAPARTPVHPVLWIMVAVMVGFELLFAAVDAGLAPQDLGRWEVYRHLAFFNFSVIDGTLYRWVPISLYKAVAQPPGAAAAATLVTHALLHGGWLHLAFNGAAFLGLGHAIVQSIGIGRFLAVFVVTASAGAVTFAVISSNVGPMVGASGAIFGFLALVTAWQEHALRLTGVSRAPIWKRIAALVAINAVMAVGLGGLLAWEAHLGGFVAGWLLAGLFRPRRGPAPGF